MHNNNNYDLLSYNKWNRRLMNLYWICNVIILVTEIILFVYLYQFDTLWFPPAYHMRNLILLPTVLTFSCTALCEVLVFFLKKKYRNFQPYIVTFTSIAYCTILLMVHYTINILYVAYIIPIIFALIYDNKRVLSSTFFCSLVTFIGVYCLYLSNTDLPYLSLTVVDVIITAALILCAYLICKLILSRYRQIIDILIETERAAYESKKDKEYAEALAENRSRFLANMSHEIRTPMNGIIGLTELALDEGSLSKKGKDYMVKVRNSAIGLLDIVNNILDISKIDAGEMRLEKKSFDLREVLSECETLIAHDAGQKGLKLYFYNEAALGSHIIGDPIRLRQALLNLLSNAVKFTYNGSVTLLAKTDETLTTSNKIPIYFEISDTGIGITNEQRKEIFEPFKQADDSAARGFDGTGLGLSITKSIIEAMGGKVDVSSIPNAGSRFSFSLEFERSNAEHVYKDTGHVRIEHPVFAGDVLLCEDNMIGKLVAQENLEKLGLNVVWAENGKTGVDIASQREQENKPFDIILMDIHMPVMDGLQAAKELIDMNVNTPIIAMTANVMAHDRERYLSAGMADCLYKPFKARELWSCLLKYLTPVEMTTATETRLKADKNAPVDIALGLENNIGNEKIYYKSLNIFIKEQPKTLAILEKAIAGADFPLANRIAHTAKNNAKIIGAVRLAELLTVLEESLRRDGSYFTNSMMDEYKEELFQVLNYITQINIT